MSALIELPIVVRCDTCGKELRVGKEIPIDSITSSLWKARWFRETNAEALQKAEVAGWVTAEYGIAACPECVKKIAESEKYNVPKVDGVIGLIDTLVIPGRMVKACKRKIREKVENE